jgi:hypothetical protein
MKLRYGRKVLPTDILSIQRKTKNGLKLSEVYSGKFKPLKYSYQLVFLL